MIGINNITFFISNRCLFSGVRFQVSPGDRIGLVGPNGAGKTTLLRMLTGRLTPEQGTIDVERGTHIGYLEQDVHETDPHITVREKGLEAFQEAVALEERIHQLSNRIIHITDYDSEEYQNLIDELEHIQARYDLLEGDKKDAKVEQVLAGLGFTNDQMDQPLSTFSGGWRMRAELARLLLEKPDLLLLDEPTNHLDIDTIEWLEQYLKGLSGAIIIVSHDQMFLNRMVTQTFELRNARIYQYTGNYDAFLTQREEMIEQQQREYEAQQKEIADSEKFIERFRYKATKARQVQSRVKQLEKMELVPPPEPAEHKINFSFPEPPQSGKVVLSINNLVKTYTNPDGTPNKVFIDGQDLEVSRGDKIAVVGPNGAGKSTLARIINGNEPFDGIRQVGYNVKMAFFAQNLAEILNSRSTVLQEMEEVATTSESRTRIRDVLGSFMFSGDDVKKPVQVLSGGERSRLALARTLLEPANLLILDEPTNHLDINSKNILLDALKKFKGTVVAISHDRHFLRGFAGTIWRVGGGRVKVYPGDYAYYEWKHRQENEQARENSINEAIDEQSETSASTNGNRLGSGPKTKEQKRREAEIRNRLSQETKGLKKSIERCEKEIEKSESRKAEIEKKMMDPEFHQSAEAGPVVKEYNILQHRIDELMDEWGELTEKLESAEARVMEELDM